MKRLVEDYQSLLEIVRESVARIVGIEGFTGSGKTYLGDRLAADFGATAVHVDHYVDARDVPGAYLSHVRMDDLRAALNQIIGPVVIDAVCLRDVLQRVGMTADLFIYVKAVAENGMWHEGFHLEDFESDPGATGLPELRRSVLEYHTRVRPHEVADVDYVRAEVVP